MRRSHSSAAHPDDRTRSVVTESSADRSERVAAQRTLDWIGYISRLHLLPGDMTLDELIVTLNAIADGQA